MNETREWEEYQRGLDYNNKLNLYHKTELNWSFYNGDQWRGIKTNGLPKWTFNICKSAINYFIAFICSQKVKLQYSAENIPDESEDEKERMIKEFTVLLSNMADTKWETQKMDSKLRALMLDGANTGDFAAYVYWDDKIETGQPEKGDFVTEIVDGINVMFGNPNNPDVESQPYILIIKREMVDKLRKEAKENGAPEAEINTIVGDSDTQYTSGTNGKIELEDSKCNCIIKLYKENGEVFWNKSTRGCTIVKNKKVGKYAGELTPETKIKRYPLAFGNWESIKNSYHGMPVIEGIIDNQISINQLFAMISYWMKVNAFGKTVIDSTRIHSWSNKVGEVIKCDGPVGTDVIHQLQTGNIHQAVLKVIEMAIKFTKDFIGANDSLMGQVNPEQASGTAIISTQKQASMPLGNISANRDQFVEDLGLIWGEFFLKKYYSRKVSYKEDGKTVTADYSVEGMDDILLNCKVDVGPSTYWSEVMAIQALDKLLESNKITKLQYFERIAKMNIIPDIQGLIKDAQAELAQPPPQEDPTQQAMQFMESLPPEVQQKIGQMGEQSLPFVMELMQMPPEQQVQTIQSL